MVIFDTIHDTDNHCKNTNIHKIHILLFMNTTEECFDQSVVQTQWQGSQRNQIKQISLLSQKKQCTVEVLNKSVKKMTLLILILLKNFCVYMYGTCRTVSQNVNILNNINYNIVNSKQYAMLDLRFLEFDQQSKI